MAVKFFGVALLGLFAAAVVAAPACGSPCPSSDRTITTGSTTVGARGGVYQSSSPAGPFLEFKGGTVLHFPHKLGVVPDFVEIRLSFSENPEAPGGGGSAFAAGNQAVIAKQSADELVVRNDQCTDYFIRVTAEALNPVDAGGD